MTQYYFKHSNLEAVKLNFDQYKHPVLYFGETMHKMVTLGEFLERLKLNN